MRTYTAYRLGRPEWASDDDEAAAEYAATLPTVEVPDADVEAKALRADWRAAAAYEWAQAYLALEDRAWETMREHARMAEDAEHRSSLDGQLVAAIFGGAERRPAERAVQIGRTLPDEAVQSARAAVRAEIARHAEVEKRAAAERYAAEQAKLRAQKRDATQKRAADVAETLAIGGEYTASVPYRLQKKAAGLCWVSGILVAVPRVGDGARVRITALRSGRSYGLKYEAEGELA